MTQAVVDKFKEAAAELPPHKHANAESGAQAIRIEAQRHGVDLHDGPQLEAFLLGVSFMYMAARNDLVDQASLAVGQLLIEENL